MLYLIDGYNFLFRFIEKDSKIENQRNDLIDFIDKKALLLHLNINIVFDGHHQMNAFPNRSYTENIEIIYTPKNESADDYILEKIKFSKHPSQITVISSDNILTKKAKQMQAKIQSIESFLVWLSEKEEKVEFEQEEEYSDSEENIKRLLKIFQEKLKKQN
jgi:hypothetical protein